jgi:ubiquinone/menaquinone biosynthesis C-methylase UbiE
MTPTNDPAVAPATHSAPRLVEVLTALSMAAGRGSVARGVASLAAVGPGDGVLDVGCGPGTAAREAGRRGATVIGVDPSPVMLRLARRISAARSAHNLEWREGSAESLPLPDDSVSIAWAISTVHHWADVEAGIGELRRALAPGGQVLLVERLVKPGARGHAAHGLTADQADSVAAQLRAAGFTDVQTDVRRFGRRTVAILAGRTPG